MRYPRISHSVPVLLFVALLIGCAAVAAVSVKPPTPSTGGSPVRLRLRVTKSTLRSGEAISVWVEFLDRDYGQVQNDGRRDVVFEFASRRRSTERKVVNGGDWSTGTMYTAGDAGTVDITVQSVGLNSDQTTLVVTPRPASWLSQALGLFETTAYADPLTQFRFDPLANVTSVNESVDKDGRQLKFRLIWSPPPKDNTTVEISTDPPSMIKYNDKSSYGFANITFGSENAVAEIFVISSQEGKITLKANAVGTDKHASATAAFIKPEAKKIRFKDEPKEMPPGENLISVTMEVTDKENFPVQSGKDRTVLFQKGSDLIPVEFDPPSVKLVADQTSYPITLHLNLKDLKEAPPEIMIFAKSDGLESVPKPITLLGQVKGIKLVGLPDILPGKVDKEFNVELVDKEGNLVSTDRDRMINLTATDGTFSPPAPVKIPKGQSVARVHYVTSGSPAKAVINANSEGLIGFTRPVELVIALYWLVLSALGGGLLGGIIRHFHANGYTIPRLLPCWTGQCWDLGFVGKLVGSIVGGLILYLLVKFGLYRALGALPLPDALDSGTRLFAFLFGVVGGYAGIYLFDWLISKFLPSTQQQAAPAV